MVSCHFSIFILNFFLIYGSDMDFALKVKLESFLWEQSG